MFTKSFFWCCLMKNKVKFYCSMKPAFSVQLPVTCSEVQLICQHEHNQYFIILMERNTTNHPWIPGMLLVASFIKCKMIAVLKDFVSIKEVACTHLDVDLVCVTVTEKLPFYFKRPPVNVAIDRGLGFELVYSPAIKDSTIRRYTISNALNLMQICKGKNIIISSAAERPLEIRGPYDVANLGLLFGLSESDAKAAVSINCRAALLHGETRRTAFGIISTVKKPRPSEGDDDSLPACKKAKCEG
ncbi:ribonuclease P protein subunit p30 isoform X3 [Cavia porcellus]|uniref:ribonuclease P protein subunit p30 isoform X3 n=1 Tax=Cavia porcellus TaxID=10141 RepID=UPI002FE04B82